MIHLKIEKKNLNSSKIVLENNFKIESINLFLFSLKLINLIKQKQKND